MMHSPRKLYLKLILSVYGEYIKQDSFYIFIKIVQKIFKR